MPVSNNARAARNSSSGHGKAILIGARERPPAITEHGIVYRLGPGEVVNALHRINQTPSPWECHGCHRSILSNVHRYIVRPLPTSCLLYTSDAADERSS